MADRDIASIVQNCQRFLAGHPRRSVQRLLQEAAEHPWATLRSDQYGNGGAVAELEREVAGLLGKEAAVFMPSGTMAQPIALRIWSDRASNPRVAFHPTCHLYIHEQMGYRELHRLEEVLLGHPDRLIEPDDLAAIDVSTVLLELPQREIGGQLPTWEELVATVERARAEGARLHLDGARLWECAPYYSRTYSEIAGLFDSVYVSFYKVLGGLPGAILAGPADFIAEARVWQRRQGGNLHQQSANAITAKMGMDRHLPKMPDYVSKAQEVASILSHFPGVRVMPEHPPTNMMHVYFPGDGERLIEAALDAAEQEKVCLFLGLGEKNKVELWCGEASLELSKDEITRLFERLIDAPKIG